MGQRQRIADALHAVGALGLALTVRRSAKLPLLSVVTYHHIYQPTAGYPFDDAVADASPTQFRRQLELLRERCTLVNLAQVIDGLRGVPLPPNPVLIAFDDGYKSNLEVAAPILRDLDVSAVFFIATDFVDERRLYWWEALAYIAKRAPNRRPTLAYPESTEVDLDAPRALWRLNRIVKHAQHLDVTRFVAEFAAAAAVAWDASVERALCDQLIMTWEEVRALARGGMDIGSHTRSHRVLQTVPDDELAAELTGSRELIERQIGKPVRAIAYPVGHSIMAEPRLRKAVVAAGYDIGFTNATGVNLVSAMPGVPSRHRLDVRRLATDREMSDAMFLAQVAVPPLAYNNPPPTSH